MGEIGRDYTFRPYVVAAHGQTELATQCFRPTAVGQAVARSAARTARGFSDDPRAAYACRTEHGWEVRVLLWDELRRWGAMVTLDGVHSCDPAQVVGASSDGLVLTLRPLLHGPLQASSVDPAAKGLRDQFGPGAVQLWDWADDCYRQRGDSRNLRLHPGHARYFRRK